MTQHIESRIQSAFKKWFDLQYPEWAPLCFAVGNGGRRSKIEAAIMKGEGVVAGVADVIIAIPRGGYGHLGLEFKTDKGRQSDKQKAWEAVSKKAGNCYYVVRSVEAAVQITRQYMNGELTRDSYDS